MPSKAYKVPRDLNRDLRELLEDLVENAQRNERGLEDADQAIKLLQDPDQEDDSTVTFTRTPTGGDIPSIPIAKKGTVLIVNPREDVTFTDADGNLRLAGDAASTDADDVIALVSTGSEWIEIARSGAGMGQMFGCPVTITQTDTACNPIFQIFEPSNVNAVFYYRNSPNKEMLVDGDIDPWFDFAGGKPLYNCGNDTQYWKSVRTQELKVRQIRFDSFSPTTISSTPQNNYNLAAGTVATIYRLSASLAVSITGFVAPTGGVNQPIIDLVNVGSFTITLEHEDVGSSAANRIITGNLGNPLDIDPDDTARIWYDATTNRYRVLK